MRILSVFTVLFFSTLVGLQAEDEAIVDLTKIDRKIVKEPQYDHEPHYALVVIGMQAQHRSWLVMDGSDVLYVDRNGNGDLTDPEDRIELDVAATRKVNLGKDEVYSGMNHFDIGEVAGVKLSFMFWVRKPNASPKDEFSRKLLSEVLAHNWENGTLWRIPENAGQAQNPVLMTATPAKAQIAHLEGPLTFGLKWGERQRFQPWPKPTVFDLHIGTPMLPAEDCPRDMFSPLTEQEIPRDLHPVAVVTFPPAKPGGKPIVETFELNERCCGDTVLGRISVPKDIGPGPASVTVSYPAWKVRNVEPATFEVTIGDDPKYK